MRRTLRRFARHRAAVGSAVALALVTLGAFLGPLVWRFRVDQITPDNSQPPSSTHPLGTDSLGRDMLAQVMRGTQQSLLIAITVAVLATVVGTTVGVVAGYRRGWADAVLMRVVDLVLTVPTIAVAAVLGHTAAQNRSGWILGAMVLAALMWTSVARVVRSVVLELREREFVTASTACGAGPLHVMRRHILPNVAGPVIVSVTILVAAAILTETALSFIGFGVRPPDTSLGLLVSDAQAAVSTRPWLFYFPGLVILVIALSINFVGDGLRDALDPTQASANGARRRRALALPLSPGVAPDPAEEHDQVVGIRGLSVRFATDEGELTAIDGVDLDVRRGEIVGLVGESGSGKTVLASAIMGLLPAGATLTGSVRHDGVELVGLGERAYRELRGRRIALVVQDPLSSLSPVHTVGNQVAEAVRVHRRVDRAEAWEQAEQLLRRVGIPDAARRMRGYPHEFSGGMRQRVVIAMAIANDPELIIADEPTTALDVTVQAQVLQILTTIARESHAAVLLITHDLGVVAEVAQRVAVMYAGRIVEVGETAAMLADPAMPYTRGLLDAMPDLHRPRGTDAPAIPGSPPLNGACGPGCAFLPRCPLATTRCAVELPALEVPPGRPPGHRARCHHPSPAARHTGGSS